MSSFPVKPVRLPRDLRGVKNGTLTRAQLVDIKPNGQLHPLAARAWRAMRSAAKKDGVLLGHVGAYRPLAAQEALFAQRYDDKPTGDPRKITRTYKGKVWHLRRGMAPAGTPGTSNHGLGLAIDVAVIVNRKTVAITADPDGKGPLRSGLQWMLANADRFGFSWEVKDGPQAEAWHVRYHAGDKVPQAVLDYEAAKAAAGS